MSRISKTWLPLGLVLATVLIAGGSFIWYTLRDNRPVLRVYCGGTMRRPMEELIPQFEAEHHVRIETFYNGCGVLVGQMKGGAEGDVYYACDSSFMNEAKGIGAIDESYPVAAITHFRPVIMVKKGNPKNIRTIDDLGSPGLKIGLGVATHGAVGRTGWQIIRRSPKFEQIKKNICEESPTADYLATQMISQLDAVIIWDVVARNYANDSDMVPIGESLTDQPIALMKKSANPELARQFIEFMRSAQAREVFAKHGFIVNAPASQP